LRHWVGSLTKFLEITAILDPRTDMDAKERKEKTRAGGGRKRIAKNRGDLARSQAARRDADIQKNGIRIEMTERP